MDLTKLVCSFINPDAAKNLFSEGEVSESDGFMDDLMKINPNTKPEEFQDILESMEE